MISSSLPIAMLHHVADRDDWMSLHPFLIKKETFLLFLNAIESKGLVTTTFKLLDSENRAPRNNELIITFDDCGRHLLDFAIPELQKRKSCKQAGKGQRNPRQWDQDHI